MSRIESKAIYVASFTAIALIGFFATALVLRPNDKVQQAVTTTASSVFSTDRYVDVQASGTEKVSPDALDLPISISATAASNEQATSQAANAASKVRSALTKYSIAASDITTTSIVTNAVYSYDNNIQKLTGYQATQSLDVTVRNTKSAGALIDAVTKAGGNHVAINGATPFIVDPTHADSLAEAAAIAAAKSKALTYASSLGVKLGSIIFVTEQPSSISPFPLMTMKASANTETQINLGTQSVTVSVDARWSIQQ